MATKGWYPDPGGQFHCYRYWDGSEWSSETTSDPTRTPPPRPLQDSHPNQGGRGWVVALVVLIVLTVVAVIVMLFATGGLPNNSGHATEDNNSSKPTVSAWDETSTPTQTPPPPDDNGGVWVDCPDSTGVGNTPQPAGRVAAAGLSFAIEPGYSTDEGFYFSMAYDFHGVGQSIPYGDGYWSSSAVGLISFADGFTDMRTTAQQAMQCWSMTYHPRDTDPDVLIGGEQMSISGHAAWHVRWHIIYTEDEPIAGEILDVIIVDMGASADYFGMFICCQPVNDPDFAQEIGDAIASLTVT